MSRLDELIAELCPNGVEYRTFGESATNRLERCIARPIKNFITTEPTGASGLKLVMESQETNILRLQQKKSRQRVQKNLVLLKRGILFFRIL